MTKEHHGRVRAVGSHVTPTVYFNVPKGKGVKIEFRVQQEEFLAQKEELMETKARLQKLEALVHKMTASPLDVTEDKGSCSAKMSHPVKFSFVEPAKQLFNEEKTDDDEDVTLVDTLDALQVYLEPYYG